MANYTTYYVVAVPGAAGCIRVPMARHDVYAEAAAGAMRGYLAQCRAGTPNLLTFGVDTAVPMQCGGCGVVLPPGSHPDQFDGRPYCCQCGDTNNPTPTRLLCNHDHRLDVARLLLVNA